MLTTKRTAYSAILLIAAVVGGHANAQAFSSRAGPSAEPSLPYVVAPADNVIKISRDILINAKAWTEVASFNQLKNPNVIIAGQKLAIPLRLLRSAPAGSRVVSATGDVQLGNTAAVAGANLAEGAQVKTGANSSAVIELGDGSRIKVLPNSLAELVANRNFVMRDTSVSGSTNWFSGLMRLSEGALEALASSTTKRATPLKIETPTSIIGVRGTEFRVAFTAATGAVARTEVIQGVVRADSAAQASGAAQANGADLPIGTGAVMKPTDKKINVVPLLPAPDISSLSEVVLKPQGNWAMPQLAGASAYRVQVANDARFDQIVRDFVVSGNQAELGSLPSGNWFARVRGIDASGLEGFDTVKLIAVKDGQWRVTYSSLSLSEGKAVLSWTGQQADGQAMAMGLGVGTVTDIAGGGYTTTLARNADLTEGVTTLQSSGANVVLGALQPGVYYIRMRTAGGLQSETYRLELSGNWAITELNKAAALQAIR